MADSETETSPSQSPNPLRGLIHQLRSLTRFVLVQTEEEHLFIKNFVRLRPKHQDRTWVFNAEYGLQLVRAHLKANSTLSFSVQGRSREDMLNASHNAMNTIQSHDPGAGEDFYLVTDPEIWFSDSLMVRRLVNLATQLQSDQRVVICLYFIGHPSVTIPKKLRQFFETVQYELSEAEVKETVQYFIELFGGLEMLKDMSTFRGLTTFEIGSAITQSVIATRAETNASSKWEPGIDPDFIRRYKDSRLQLR